MMLRMAITVFLGVEREKISQYVLEKLLLFFFSVSDSVSLRTKTRTGRAGEGVAASAWSDPSLLPAETPFPLHVGWEQRWALPPTPSSIHPGRCKEHLGTRALKALGVPGGRERLPSGTGLCPRYPLSILGEQYRSPVWLPKPPLIWHLC